MGNDATIAEAASVIAATEEKDNNELFDSLLPRLDLSQSYIKIAEDKMTAWLYLVPPEVGEEPYTKQEIKDYLVHGEVVAGFRESNLSAMVKKEIYFREIEVAVGNPQVDGIDGYFEYTFDATEEKAPAILADGSVDYTSVNRITNVRVGDQLAKYQPAQQGKDGLDVLGNVVKGKAAKDLPALRGASISKRDTSDTYFAEKEGKVELRDGKLDIQSTHEIYGDVDQTIGKVEFFGDVVINGNVESGVVIRAGRNIEIRGSVEAASLFAGGDIILQRGIQGQQRAKASARGSVFAKFIEQTVVTAGGNVTADSIMNSRITAEGKVMLSGKRGTLVGGYTHALQGIDVVSLGNDAETRTVVHAGYEADIYFKGINLKKAENQTKKRMATLHEEIDDLKRKAQTLGEKYLPVLKASAEKIKLQEKEITEELKALAEEQQEIFAQMEKGKGAQIRVDGNIYRGCVICIGQLEMPIENNTCYMNYTTQGGMIVGNVIVH